MSWLLDTSILIDYLRGRAPAIAFIEGLKVEPAASVASLTEIYAGLRHSREEARVAALESRLRLHVVTAEVARRGGVFMRLYSGSHGIDEFDALIAATAEQHELKLATLNIKHFPMFPRLKPPF
jgi:predicted nucleic acid-binding protein